MKTSLSQIVIISVYVHLPITIYLYFFFFLQYIDSVLSSVLHHVAHICPIKEPDCSQLVVTINVSVKLCTNDKIVTNIFFLVSTIKLFTILFLYITRTIMLSWKKLWPSDARIPHIILHTTPPTHPRGRERGLD